MHFCTHTHKKVVRKARRSGRTRAETYKAIFRIREKNAKAIAKGLIVGIKEFRSRIDVDLLARQIDKGLGHALAAINWQDMHECFSGYTGTLRKMYGHVADTTALRIPARVQKAKNERLDAKNPRIERLIEKNAGERIQGLQEDTQKVLQSALTRGVNTGRDSKWIADRIKDSVGLDERREKALMNYANTIYSQNMKPGRADKLVAAYGERLLESRAETIARTEAARIANEGQLMVWQDAVEGGVLPETTKKIWVVDGNPCDVCEPMDDVAVPLDDIWVLDDGTPCYVPSDSHPNCMCGMDLDFGEDEE
jgi:hypothetical protein